MKKALIFGVALALVCGAGFISTSSAEEKGPEHAVITDGTDSSKKPAYFPHRDHQTRLNDCGICHHGKDAAGKQVPYKAGETKQQKCSTCHNNGADGIKLEDKPGVSPIQRAGHGRCKTCHQKSKSTKTPPANLNSCGACHTKK